MSKTLQSAAILVGLLTVGLIVLCFVGWGEMRDHFFKFTLMDLLQTVGAFWLGTFVIYWLNVHALKASYRLEQHFRLLASVEGELDDLEAAVLDFMNGVRIDSNSKPNIVNCFRRLSNHIDLVKTMSESNGSLFTSANAWKELHIQTVLLKRIATGSSFDSGTFSKTEIQDFCSVLKTLQLKLLRLKVTAIS